MTKLTLPLSTIVDAQFTTAFNKLLRFEFTEPIANALTRVGRQCQSASNAFSNARNIAIRKYGERVSEDGKPSVRLLPENTDAFNREMEELLKVEVAISLEAKVKLPANVRLTPCDIEALQGIIVLPEPLPEVVAIKNLEQIEAEAMKLLPPVMAPGLARVNATA